MKILLLSIGLTISIQVNFTQNSTFLKNHLLYLDSWGFKQSWWGNAYSLKSISQSKPFRIYSSRSTSVETNPGGTGEIKVTGNIDVSVDNGGNVFAATANNSTYSVGMQVLTYIYF